MRAKTGFPARELFADFDLAFQLDNVYITVHARGGSAARGAQNPEYEILVQTLLERLRSQKCVLEDVLLASKTVAHLPRSQRRISPKGFVLPIRLDSIADITDLRLAIRRAVVTSHSKSANATHGNATKRIELVTTCPVSASDIAAILEWGNLDSFGTTDTTAEAEADSFFEGGLVLRQHLVRERNQALVKAAKSRFQTANGRLYCEVCGFDFASLYGELGDGFIEAHHDCHRALENQPVVGASNPAIFEMMV
jgi:hypothetical protein